MGVFDLFRNHTRAGAGETPPSRAHASHFSIKDEETVFNESDDDGFTEFTPSQYGDSLRSPLSLQSGMEKNSSGVQHEQRVRQRLQARPGTRVLIIDESPAVVRGLRRMMRQNEFEPIEGLGSERGLELAFTAQPELIFLAVAMQGQSGFNILRTLRRDERTRNVPVIMMSGNVQATEAEYLRRMGADDFMTKPFSRADVFKRIERLLDSSLVPRRSTGQ